MNEYVRKASSAFRQDITPLMNSFFKDSNINLIQKQLQAQVKKNTKQSIDRQNNNELFIVMQYVYSNFARHCTDNHVEFLNQLVLSEVVPMVSSNVLQHMSYLNDISQSYKPIDRSSNPSIKGTDVNEFKSFF
jgi:hypothetical protein